MKEVRFLQDYRGVLTDEAFFTSGSVASFNDKTAKALAIAGRAEIIEEEDMAWKANRSLYWTKDQRRVVEEGDPEAAMLYRGKGQSISDNDLEKYGIEREVKPAKAAAGPTENKAANPASKSKAAK